MNWDPLTGLDGAFLALESGTSHLHVASVLVLDPPEGRRSLFSPSTRFAQIRQVVESRLHLAPPLRQRAMRVPLGLHHPVWVDDPEFDLDDHLRRASVPAPGRREELDDLVADLVSRPLDPERPLWEMVVVEGLEHGRTALVAKLHHAILDGVSGAALLAGFLDLGPRPRVLARAEPWAPRPAPSQLELLRYTFTSLTRQPAVAIDAVHTGIGAIADVGSHNRTLAEAGGVPPPPLFSAPRTSLNGTLSSRRRFARTEMPLDDAKLVRDAFGVTVNDVVLAGVAGALRALLERRGEQPEGALVALMPVSTRGPDAGASLGNEVSGALVSLATTTDDPVERLLAIAEGSVVAKAQARLTGGRLLADVAQMTPPALASRMGRWADGLRVFDRLSPPFTVTVSSVPGPQATLWCAGSRMIGLYPVGPVAAGVGLNVTSMSYRGALHFGLLACRRLVPDLAELAVLLDDALAELVAGALEVRRSAG